MGRQADRLPRGGPSHREHPLPQRAFGHLAVGLENVAVVAVVDVDEDDFADFLSYLFMTNMCLGMLDEKKRSVGR